jgi:hypothetical protein
MYYLALLNHHTVGIAFRARRCSHADYIDMSQANKSCDFTVLE